MRNSIEKLNFDFVEFLPFRERPFRAKFIPSKIWKDLDKYKNNSEGLSNYCKKWRTSVKLYKRSRSKVFDEYIAVAGEYDMEDRRITAIIMDKSFDQFNFTKQSWARFKFKFIQMMMHELIHFMQFERRDGEFANYYLAYKKTGKLKRDQERRYLSNFDEIQAYAHCIYLDLLYYHPNKSPADLNFKKRSISPTLSYYLRTFEKDPKNNAALNKLLQQIVKWEKKYKKLKVRDGKHYR